MLCFYLRFFLFFSYSRALAHRLCMYTMYTIYPYFPANIHSHQIETILNSYEVQ